MLVAVHFVLIEILAWTVPTLDGYSWGNARVGHTVLVIHCLVEKTDESFA